MRSNLLWIQNILGLLGSILNISLQLAPMPAIIEGFKKMEIKNMTINYFIVGIVQGILWIGYGLNIHDIVVYGPNITIYILFTIYLNITIYVKSRFNLFYMTNIPLLILCLLSCTLFPEIVNVVGATIVSICWQTTNVETMRLALKYKDQGYINFLLSLVTFSCFTCMALYSLMIKAYVMFLPYFYGTILNFVNMYIYYWAGGKIASNDCFIVLIFKILKPENTTGSENSADIDNTKPINDDKASNIIN